MFGGGAFVVGEDDEDDEEEYDDVVGAAPSVADGGDGPDAAARKGGEAPNQQPTTTPSQHQALGGSMITDAGVSEGKPTKPPPPSMDAYSRHADGRAAEGRRYPPTVLASDVERLAAGSIALRRHKKATRHAATGLDDWHRAEIAGALRQRLGADGA